MEHDKKTMTQEEYLNFAQKKCNSILDLITRKNADYTNGGSAFANFEKSLEYGIDPFIGLCLRTEDKWQRIRSFVKQGKLEVKGEGVEDALTDVIGYCLIALAMLESKNK